MVIAFAKKSEISFKPYYKWIVLNTKGFNKFNSVWKNLSFKPYYKWIVLNTKTER